MFIARLTHILLQDGRYAIPLCILVSILPFVNAFAWIIMAFVAIRRDWTLSLPVLMAVLVPQVALAVLLFHNYLMVLQLLVSGGLLWLAAVCWQRVHSWTWVLEMSLLAASGLIILIHLWVPDLANQWYHLYREYWQRLSDIQQTAGWWREVSSDMLLSLEQHQHMVKMMSRVATGATIAVMILANSVQLLIAQWWEQRFFKSKDWYKPLYQIRLSRAINLIALLLVGLAYYGSMIAQDLLPIYGLVFALAGLSLFHAHMVRARKQAKTTRMRMIAIYTLLLLLLVYAWFGLIVLALCDSIFDLRSRWSNHQLKQT